MKRSLWMERNFGKRPTPLPQAQVVSRVRALRALLARQQKLCHDVERWDAIDEAIKRATRGPNRPDDL